jgi:hypothetical protein
MPLDPGAWALFDTILEELKIQWLPMKEEDLPVFG